MSTTIAARSSCSASELEIGRQALRQHGEDLGGRVDRRRVDGSVLIDGRVTVDQRVDVGDGHEDTDAVLARFGDRELIEVARVLVVDGAPETIAQVAAGGRLGARFGELVGLGQRGGREVGLETPLPHRLPRNLLQCGARGRHVAKRSAEGGSCSGF